MNNYKKGKNVEEPLVKENIPIPNLPTDFLWMQVRGGSKIRNLLNAAIKEFPEKKSVIFTGFGASVGKAITCAEIMKREFKSSLHQITKICYRLIEEYWDPLIPQLDQIVVKRRLPMIHILLTVEPLDSNELGYQSPDLSLQYKPQERKQANRGQFRNRGRGNHNRTDRQGYRPNKEKKANSNIERNGGNR